MFVLPVLSPKFAEGHLPPTTPPPLNRWSSIKLINNLDPEGCVVVRDHCITKSTKTICPMLSYTLSLFVQMVKKEVIFPAVNRWMSHEVNKRTQHSQINQCCWKQNHEFRTMMQQSNNSFHVHHNMTTFTERASLTSLFIQHDQCLDASLLALYIEQLSKNKFVTLKKYVKSDNTVWKVQIMDDYSGNYVNFRINNFKLYIV